MGKPSFFFLLIFLAAWAGGVWVTPVGPPVWGVYWLPFVIVALLFTFLLAAVTLPESPPQSSVEAWDQARNVAATALVIETFFWLLPVNVIAVIADLLLLHPGHLVECLHT